MLVSNLSKIADGAPEAMSLALHDTADFILTLIRALAPVDTGWLRDSYQKESVALLHILIGTLVSYAAHQEYGTSRQAGKPHFVPAFIGAESYFGLRLIEHMKALE